MGFNSGFKGLRSSGYYSYHQVYHQTVRTSCTVEVFSMILSALADFVFCAVRTAISHELYIYLSLRMVNLYIYS